MSRSETARSYGSSVFKEPPCSSSQWLYQFTFLNVMQYGKLPFSPHPLQNRIKIFNTPKYIGTLRISHLLRKLLLTQLIEREKLPGQNNIVNKATTGQLHPDDNLPVRDHHGHGAEVNLQVFGEFLPPSVARILYRK